MAIVRWWVVLTAGALALQARPARAETYVLPSSTYGPGANGAEFRTDVRILNRGRSAVTVNAVFYDQAASAIVPANPIRIEARNQAAFDNILHSLFGRSRKDGAYGPIRFESTAPILVTASVNNVNACGTGAASGQRLPGIAASKALTAGVIGQLAVSANSTSGYRTNLVFMNPGNEPATATVKVRRGRGDLLSTGKIGPLSANGFRQVALNGDVFPGVAGTTDANLWLEFTSDQPVLAYATIIHNVSGDPYAVIPSLDAPPRDSIEITSFTATPSNVTARQNVMLSWTSIGGTAASIDNGVGAVPVDGSVVVSPARTTTYWLTVEAPTGRKLAPATVTVDAPYAEITFDLPGGVPLVMVRIPAGTFQMGSPVQERGRGDDETQHEVTLTRDYYIGKYEVTQGQWQAVMGRPMAQYCDHGTPLRRGDDYPVTCFQMSDVRGDDGFVARLNQLLGTNRFRLPTEAEWERAARGGTTTRFSFGNAVSGDDDCGRNDEASPFVWWCWNAWINEPVGTKAANPYGLHDVHGNVWELVEDWYGPYPTGAQSDPTGPPSGLQRVARGGSWGTWGGLATARSANRERTTGYSDNTGFRLAWTP